MMKRIIKIFFCLLLVFFIYKGYQIHRDVKQVMTYRTLVREVLAEEDTGTNEDLILAMIYTETKGKEDDVMQASESATGQTNSITNNKESIRQGIQTLSENRRKAKEKGGDPWTAVQAYNFGQDYIEYVEKNGGKNSLELARKYSKEVVAPSLGNVTGKTYLYLHPISFLHGSELYVNGGNYYYSRLVEMNQFIMKLFSWF